MHPLSFHYLHFVFSLAVETIPTEKLNTIASYFSQHDSNSDHQRELSFHRMFSSWASTLQSTIAQATEAVSSAQEAFFAMENPQNEEESSKAVADSNVSPADLLMAPANIAPQHWSIVLDVAFKDSNFFVIPPSRIFESTAISEKLLSLGMLDVVKIVPTKTEIDPAGLAPLAGHDLVAATHYSVMPRFISDELFWQHCLWRLGVLRQCTSINQLVDTYEAITHEENVSEPRQRLRGVDNSKLCSELRSRALAAQQNVDWMNEKQRAVDECLKNSGGSCQLLSTFIAKKEQTDLSDSVFESCKYHKTKLASLIGELETNTSRLVGTDLDPQGNGERYNELMLQNTELLNAIAAYSTMLVEMRESQKLAQVSHDESLSPTTLPVEGLPVATESSVVAAPPVSGTVDSDDEFSVKLPWDDDEDELS